MSQDIHSRQSKRPAPKKSNVAQIAPKLEERRQISQREAFIHSLVDRSNPNRIASDQPFEWAMLIAGPYRGIFKLTFDKYDVDQLKPRAKTICLASVEISRVVAPANGRIYGASEFHCKFTNQAGKVKDLVITSDHFIRDELIRFLDGFAEVGTERGTDIHALRQILSRLAAMSKSCLQQDALDSLGWFDGEAGQHEFLAANGIETRKGFIPVEASPVAFASGLRLAARGGRVEKPVDNDESVLSLLTQLVVDPYTLEPHADYEAALFGAVGFAGLMMYPHPLPDGGYFKRVPFEYEIEGPSGVGKSPFASVIKWFFTLTPPPPGDWRLPCDFVEERPGDKKGDTMIGRNYRLAAAGNVPLIDFDFRRVTDANDPTAERRLRLRIASIEAVANNDDGGTIGTQSRGARQRAERQGGIIRTLEDDPAIVTLPEYWSTEKRSYLHNWARTVAGDGIPGDRGISRDIVKRHPELYAWGIVLLRHLLNKPKKDLAEYFTTKMKEAEDKHTDRHWSESHSDASWQRGYAIRAVASALIWIDALKARSKKSFFAEWLESRIPGYIANRVARFDYLFSLNEGEKMMTPEAIYLKTLRKMLRYGDAFIANQYDGMPFSKIEDFDSPVEAVDLGYVRYAGEWRPKHHPVGYLTKEGRDYVLMHPDSFDLIKEQVKKDGHSVLGWSNAAQNPVYKGLAKAGHIEPGEDQTAKRAYVAGVRGRYLHLKLSALKASEADDEDSSKTEGSNADGR